MYQKLLTKEIEKKLAKYPIYSQDGRGLEAEIVVKFFDPCSDYTFYVLEAQKLENGDYEFFGLCYCHGQSEYGYQLFSELKKVRNRWGLGIERDMYFDNQKIKDLSKNEIPDFLFK